MTLERLSLTAENPREQIMQIRSYLFQLIDQLELILDTVDENNLSQAFNNRIVGMENDIKTIRADIEKRQTIIMNRIKEMETGTDTVHVVTDVDPGTGVAVDYADGTIILVKESQEGE